jgi:trans-aconitate 2-methyltransferase
MTQLNAEHYHQNSTVQKSLADELLSWHTIQPNENILDLGCGDGVITAKLSQMVPQGKVLGIDPSSEMIALARQGFPKSDFAHLDFQIGKAEDYHGQNHYSFITAFNCLHWVRDLKQAFQYMHEALLPQGKLLALTYPAESPYWTLFTEVLQRPIWQNYFSHSICPHWLTSELYRQLVQSTEFHCLRIETLDGTVTYENPEAFKNYVNGWLPCLFDASASVLSDYLDEVTQLVWKRYGTSQKAVIVPFKKLHLYLEK